MKKIFIIFILSILLVFLGSCYYKWFYSLSVVISGEGTVNVQGEKDPDKDKYEKYTDLILTAEASPGWKFVDWTGDISSNDNPLNFKIQDDINLTANFERDTFSIFTTIVGNGRIEISPEKDEYEYGEEITLKAFPDENWEFHGWSGDIISSEKNVTFNIDKNMNITATFEEKQFGVSVEIEGEGDIEITPDKELYDYGDLVSFAATPEDGWTFEGWGGYIESDDNPLLVQIEKEINLNALFIKNEFPVNIEISGSGSVEKLPDKSSYFENEEVQITAIPDAGWSFDSWRGDINSTQTEITVTVDATKNYSANFIQNKYYITGEITGEGTINMNPEKEYYSYGDVVEVMAIPPEDDWIFSKWGGSFSGEENPKEIIIESDLNIEAIFKELFYCDINIEGEGVVNIEPLKEYYFVGDNIQLSAQPSEDCEFYKWEINGIISNENPIDIKIDEDKSIKCFFKPEDSHLILFDKIGLGTISITPEEEYYYKDEIVILKAFPEENWYFKEWTGKYDTDITSDYSGRLSERSVKVYKDDLNLIANFVDEDKYFSNLTDFDEKWNESKYLSGEEGTIEAYESFYKDTKAGIYFIDIRGAVEVNQGHIKNAVWIPFSGDEKEDLIKVQNLFPDPSLCRFVVYAERGGAIAEGKKLNEWGYKSIVMTNGICGWKDMGYPSDIGVISNK